MVRKIWKNATFFCRAGNYFFYTLSLDPQTVETFSSFGRQVVGFLKCMVPASCFLFRHRKSLVVCFTQVFPPHSVVPDNTLHFELVLRLSCVCNCVWRRQSVSNGLAFFVTFNNHLPAKILQYHMCSGENGDLPTDMSPQLRIYSSLCMVTVCWKFGATSCEEKCCVVMNVWRKLNITRNSASRESRGVVLLLQLRSTPICTLCMLSSLYHHTITLVVFPVAEDSWFIQHNQTVCVEGGKSYRTFKFQESMETPSQLTSIFLG